MRSRTGLLLAERAPTGDDAGDASEPPDAAPVSSAPRPIAPLSTSKVTTRTPTLRWTLPAGTDGVIVNLCQDRACRRRLSSFTAIGTSAKVPTALPAGVVFWRLRAAAHGAPGGGFSPTWQFTVGRHSAPVDTSWGSTLDVDGDGLADVVVGADGADDYAGAAYLYMSGASGLHTPPQVLPLPPKASNFGGVVGSAGDIDGDGYGDLIVGAYSHDGYSGAAYLYRGGPGGLTGSPLVLLDPDMTPEQDEFGATVASAGDVNGDGYADVLASEDGGHAVDVFLGGRSGPAATPQVLNVGGVPTTGSYGATVAGAGDVDGDGFEDVLVGAPGMTLQVGRAYLFFGGPSGPRTPPTVLQDPAKGPLDLFGDALQ